MGGPYLDEEEELEEQRRRALAADDGSAPPVTTGAPAPPPLDVPPVASAPVGGQPAMVGGAPPPMIPLTPIAHPDAPPVTSHALSPARQKLQALIDQGAPPVQPLHGGKKVLDTLGKIFVPGLEQRLRYAPQSEYNRERGEAEENVANDIILHPQPPPKADEWTVVPGQTGPNGEPIQENKSTGTIRYAPGLTGAHPTKLPAPKINEVSGIPVSITDGKGKEYAIDDPNLPPELKPIADRALAAHGQHVDESRTPKFTAEQEAYAKKLRVKPEEVTSDQWEAYDKKHHQDIHIDVNGSNVPQGEAGAALKGVPKSLIPHATADATKAGEEFNTASQAADDMKTFITEARKGNKLAYSYAPTEGVLTFNTGRGVKRVNMPEIASYAGSGSGWDRVQAFFGKAVSGSSISDDVLTDMETMHAKVAENAKSAYERRLKIINHTYGSGFKPVDFGTDGESSGGGNSGPIQVNRDANGRIIGIQ